MRPLYPVLLEEHTRLGLRVVNEAVALPVARHPAPGYPSRVRPVTVIHKGGILKVRPDFQREAAVRQAPYVTVSSPLEAGEEEAGVYHLAPHNLVLQYPQELGADGLDVKLELCAEVSPRCPLHAPEELSVLAHIERHNRH